MPRFQLFALLSLALYLVYYVTKVAKRPRFVAGKGPFRDFIITHGHKFFERRFCPPIWCIGPNVQSLIGMIFLVSPDRLGGSIFCSAVRLYVCKSPQSIDNDIRPGVWEHKKPVGTVSGGTFVGVRVGGCVGRGGELYFPEFGWI